MRDKITSIQVPSRADWGDLDADIELPYAYEVFGGKNRVEVQGSFSRCVIERSSELLIVPNSVFPYYMLAFNDFVQWGRYEVADSGEVFACFLKTVERRMSNAHASVEPIIEEIYPTIQWIVDVQDAFKIDRSVYGDYLERASAIQLMR